MSLSGPFILRPVATSLLMAAVLLMGIIAYTQLPISALIEARSCERLKLLAEALPPGRLKDLYRRLFVAEAVHHRLFTDLAASECGAHCAGERLRELRAAEGSIAIALPLAPRIH